MTVSIPDDFADVLREPDVLVRTLTDDGTYPNNESLPVLVYRQAVRRSVRSVAQTMERLFRAHRWTGTWRNGIFSYHHYHSTAHEVLGMSAGRVSVQLGGPEGLRVDVEAGDVVVLPAGVTHKSRDSRRAFQVVGAYPEGQDWDLKRGEPGDRPEADRNIDKVPLPSQDPLFGHAGPLREHWGDEG